MMCMEIQMTSSKLLTFCMIFTVMASISQAETEEVKCNRQTNSTETSDDSVKSKDLEERDNDDTSMPIFKIRGNAAFSANFSNPNLTYYKGKDAPSTDRASKDTSMPRAAAGEAEIIFEAMGKLKNGVTYGAKLYMDAHKNDTGIDKAYLYFERDNFGTIELGSLKGPDSKMLCGGQQLLGGTSGIDGTVPHDIDFATGLISPLNMYGYSNKATKVAYYTPKIYGFQLGFAITPDTKHSGHDDKDWSTGKSSNGNDSGVYNQAKGESQKPSGRNNIGVGLTHEYKFNDDWSYKAAVMGVFENTRPIKIIYADSNGPTGASEEIKLRNVCAFQTTASVKYKKFTIAAGYLNNGKGRLPKKEVYTSQPDDFIPGGFLVTRDGNSGQAWNLGAKYEYKKWEFSTVYHNISRKVAKSEKIKGHITSFAVDYLVCSGLKIFGEFDYIYAKSCDTACKMYNLMHEKKDAIKKQNTAVFSLGAKVTF